MKIIKLNKDNKAAFIDNFVQFSLDVMVLFN